MIKKVLKNDYIFSVMTKIFMVGIAFFHSIVLARFLGPDLKGVHATVYSIISIGAVIINLSCQQAYPYFRKKYGYENYFNKFMSFMLVYHLIFMLIAVIASIFVYGLSSVSLMALLLIPIDGFSIVSSYIYLVEYPRDRNIALLVVDIIDTVFVTLLLFFVDAQPIHVFFIFLLPFVIKILYFNFKNRFHFDKNCFNCEFIKELFKFSFFPMVSMLLTMLNYKVDVLMLKASNCVSMVEIGIYSIGVSLADKVVYIPDAVKEILLSKLAKGKGSEEVAMAMRFCFPVSLAVTLFLIIIGEPFINFLYGSEYNGAYLITLICVFGTSMMVFFKMISQYNNVNGKQRINMYMLFIIVLINVVLNYCFIPIYGMVGAAIASLISYVVCAIIFMIYFNRVTGIAFRKMIVPTRSDFVQIKKMFLKNNNDK